MAPIKFEEQIKDKLERRTVTPSADAWSKLSQQLAAEEKKNKKMTFWWLGIAASITALIFMSINYSNTINETKIEEIIVKDKIEKIISPTTEDRVLEQNITDDKEEIVEADKTKTETKTNNKPINTSTQKQGNQLLKFKEKVEAIAKVKKEKTLVVTPKRNFTEEKQEFNPIVAELQNVKSKVKNQSINQEVDFLLKLANRELLMDKAIKKNTKVVDSKTLLQDVEEDMGQSFRTRIYETLKKGYKEVKEAVVKRNN